MRKHLSKALALALAMSSLASVSLAEGSVLNVWCWNDEFQSRFNAYYPEVKEVAEDQVHHNPERRHHRQVDD